MESLSVGLLLSLVWNSCALLPRAKSPLDIHPKEPLVEVGGSIQLHCSLDCPGGKVQWEGLDTDLGDVVSNHTSSILTMTNAVVRMEGMKICTGQCQKKTFQKTVELKVYSFPDTLQLVSQPTTPTAGQPVHLSCLMRHVYPRDALTLSWFQGDARVPRHVEDTEDSELFTFSSELETPMAAEHTTYRCEAELQIGQLLLRQSRTVTIQAQEKWEISTTTEVSFSQTATTANHFGTPERPAIASDGNSFLETIPGPLLPFRSMERTTTFMTAAGTTTVAPLLESLPNFGMGSSTGSLSTARVSFGEVLTVTPEPTNRAPRTTLKHSKWSLKRSPGTFGNLRVTSKALPTTDWQPATSTAAATRHGDHPRFTTPDPKGLCRPVITPFPPQGTVGEPLCLTCHAVECHEDTQVWWVETPVAQSQYHQEKVKGRSTLMVDSISLEHQGVYRCMAMTSLPRMASVRVVVVSAAALNTNTLITIGVAGSCLGLFVTSYVFRRAWQRRGSYCSTQLQSLYW